MGQRRGSEYWRETLCRYLVLAAGLWILALGVAVSTKADLGVSPISCLPYVLSKACPWTMGELTAAMHMVFILVQLALLRRKTPWNVLLQIPIAFVFGYFTDLTLELVAPIPVSSYARAMALCLISCLLIAIGVYLEFKANVAVLAGEGMSMAFVKTFGWEFGSVKIGFDCSLVVVSCLSCLFVLGEWTGVREGTFIAAVLVGMAVRMIDRIFPSLAGAWSFHPSRRESRPKPHEIYRADAPPVFSIDREYGSGGHAVGKLIAEKMGIEFYDTELVELTAERSGLTPEYIRKNGQQLASRFLYELYAQNYAYSADELPPADAVYLAQSKVIRELAATRSCVIVGQCANYILKGRPHLCSVYLHAAAEKRRKRVIENYGVPEKRALEEMNRMDLRRRRHCRYFTGHHLGDPHYYDIVLDTSEMAPEDAADLIIDLARKGSGTAGRQSREASACPA